MGHAPAAGESPAYKAFISYSHADDRFAGWLHRALENGRASKGQSLRPIFIDRAELVAGPDLSAQVKQALQQSAALIVIASPSSRASRWVGQEIELFRELHPDRPILTALFRGEPEEAFHDSLLLHRGEAIEPLAADFRDGQDGKRLGLLKLIAGLTQQPLDRLVQREAQTRQRRVMAVTAAAVLLILILSTALVAAIKARHEAERQRAEAEGLVEYMLTDLRQKLIGVGRLDVMQSVNGKAMAFYSAQTDLSALSPDSLERRARVIEAMGQDDEQLGEADQAYAKYAELYRVTADLLKRDPDNPDRIFAHAGSENRLALLEFGRGDIKAAEKRFGNAHRMLEVLPAAGRKPQWDVLNSLITGNLCAIAQKSGQSPGEAVGHCQLAIALAQNRLRDAPGDASTRYDLAMHFYWLGLAQRNAGDKAASRTAFAAALATSQDLIAADPANQRWREQRMELMFQLAKLARADGRNDEASTRLNEAEAIATRLTAHDPSNRYWADYHKQIAALAAEPSHVVINQN